MNGGLLALVALAGGVGAMLRYLVDSAFTRRREGRFPIGVLVVNVSGSFILGGVVGLGSVLAPATVTVLGVGLLGGYTTFSAVHVDTVLLAQEKRWLQAAANLFGTVILAVLAAAIGVAVGALVTGL
jgi:fluoride exporter